jgi:hypothetical protein
MFKENLARHLLLSPDIYVFLELEIVHIVKVKSFPLQDFVKICSINSYEFASFCESLTKCVTNFYMDKKTELISLLPLSNSLFCKVEPKKEETIITFSGPVETFITVSSEDPQRLFLLLLNVNNIFIVATQLDSECSVAFNQVLEQLLVLNKEEADSVIRQFHQGELNLGLDGLKLMNLRLHSGLIRSSYELRSLTKSLSERKCIQW